MKGIARIAITIISQSRCLCSNFIITGKIVAAAVLSRKCVEKSQIPSSKTQEDPKRQMLKSIAHHPFGIWPIGICLELGFWDLGFRLTNREPLPESVSKPCANLSQ